MASDQHALLVNQDRVRPAPFADRCGNLIEVGLAVKPRIVRIRDKPFDRPALDLVGRPDVWGSPERTSVLSMTSSTLGQLLPSGMITAISGRYRNRQHRYRGSGPAIELWFIKVHRSSPGSRRVAFDASFVIIDVITL